MFDNCKTEKSNPNNSAHIELHAGILSLQRTRIRGSIDSFFFFEFIRDKLSIFGVRLIIRRSNYTME